MSDPLSLDRIASYSRLEPVATGGTATVYRGKTATGQWVALKRFSTPLSGNEFPVRVRREIESMRRVSHPGIIPLSDYGVDEFGHAFLVTPFVEGVTLRALLDGQVLYPEAVVALLLKVAEPLAVLHAEGLVHRDIKPENIMMTADGHIIVIDLGVALFAEHTRNTEDGTLVGSIPYMAPEQIEAGEITPAVDIWSLGVMAYEWLCGVRPFARGRSSEEVAAILAGHFRPIADLDRRSSTVLQQVIAGCLLCSPAQRFANADPSLRRYGR